MKICAECKFNIPYDGFDGFDGFEECRLSYSKCSHPMASKVDIVTGAIERRYCAVERGYFAHIKTCGPDGVNFEPREVSKLLVAEEVKPKKDFLRKMHAWFYS